MYDIKPVTLTRTCGCGATVVVTGTCGPAHICAACADRLLAIIWGDRWPAMRAHLAGLGKITPEPQPAPHRHHRRRPAA